MADLATLEQRLDEAEEAHHKLMMGDRAVDISWADGQSVSFQKAEIRKLENYIQELKNDIARAKGASKRGPIQVWPHG